MGAMEKLFISNKCAILAEGVRAVVASLRVTRLLTGANAHKQHP